MLYEYLGEEYPEVLGSILGALKGIVNVIGMTKVGYMVGEAIVGSIVVCGSSVCASVCVLVCVGCGVWGD